MKKNNFKLDLNKQRVSNLQAKQITGGEVTLISTEEDDCTALYHTIRFVSGPHSEPTDFLSTVCVDTSGYTVA